MLLPLQLNMLLAEPGVVVVGYLTADFEILPAVLGGFELEPVVTADFEILPAVLGETELEPS